MENNSTEQNDLSAYQAPEAELLVKESGTSPQFFPVSLTKLNVMYIVTFGMYTVIWFFQNWKLQEPKMEKKIRPVWRAIFSIFYTHSLFKRIHEKSEEKGMENWAHSSLATIFVIFVLLSSIGDKITDKIESLSFLAPFVLLLTFVCLYSLYQTQKVVNVLNDDVEGKLNGNFTAANIFFIVLGIIMWSLVIFGSYILATE
jgi:hypothetical protein